MIDELMMAAPNISEISIERNGRDKEVLELSSSTRQRSRSPSPLPYPSPSPSTSSMRFSNATINAPHAPEQSSKQHLAPSSPVTLTYGTVLTHRPAAGGYDLRLLQAGFHTEPCMGGGGGDFLWGAVCAKTTSNHLIYKQHISYNNNTNCL